MGLLTRVIRLMEDGVERIGRDRHDVWGSMKYATQRAAELNIQNLELMDRNAILEKRVSGLEEEVDGLRFNGPTLYSDEVAALKYAAKRAAAEGNPAACKALCNLLFRMDPMPFSAEELDRMIGGVLMPWDEALAQAAEDNLAASSPPAFVGTAAALAVHLASEPPPPDPFDPVDETETGWIPSDEEDP